VTIGPIRAGPQGELVIEQPNRDEYTGSLVDEHGCEMPGSRRAGMHWEMPPHQEEELRLRLYSRSPDHAPGLLLVQEKTIRNPAFRPAVPLVPAPLPITAVSRDLDVTLSRFLTGVSVFTPDIIPSYSIERTDTQIDYQVRERGKPANGWWVADAWVSDGSAGEQPVGLGWRTPAEPRRYLGLALCSQTPYRVRLNLTRLGAPRAVPDRQFDRVIPFPARPERAERVVKMDGMKVHLKFSRVVEKAREVDFRWLNPMPGIRLRCRLRNPAGRHIRDLHLAGDSARTFPTFTGGIVVPNRIGSLTVEFGVFHDQSVEFVAQPTAPPTPGAVARPGAVQ
jgi:hypothetical protein